MYIYGIDLENPANIPFALDGVNTSFHYYAGTEQFVVNQLFFSAKNLEESVNHTVSWVLNKSKTDGTTGLFDYAVITVEEAASSSCVVLILNHRGQAN
jgi:hypothetical protein